MAFQKVHKHDKKGYKVKANIQSLIHPYIFSQYSEDVGMGLTDHKSTQRGRLGA